jgi:hypothetical protein
LFDRSFLVVAATQCLSALNAKSPIRAMVSGDIPPLLPLVADAARAAILHSVENIH